MELQSALEKRIGPDGIETAHAVNERVSVGGLVDFSAAIALTMMRWCGVAS